jgi:uncharacterized protein YcgI (DUF1989 family)
MFARRGEFDHPSCHNSLAVALADYGISDDAVTATVNVFMNVGVDREGRISIGTPASRPGDVFAIEALCDLIAGVSACSSELTNNGRCKPIWYALAAARDGEPYEGQIPHESKR